MDVGHVAQLKTLSPCSRDLSILPPLYILLAIHCQYFRVLIVPASDDDATGMLQ